MVAITVNLPDALVQEIRQIAHKEDKSQREVIEEALKKHSKELWKKQMIEDTKKDAEYIRGNKELQEELAFLTRTSMQDYLINGPKYE